MIVFTICQGVVCCGRGPEECKLEKDTIPYPRSSKYELGGVVEKAQFPVREVLKIHIGKVEANKPETPFVAIV